MNVVLHPSAVLAERLREADDFSGGDLIRLFCEAIDLGVSRKPILEKFLAQKGGLRMPDVDPTMLFDWSRQNSFQAKKASGRATDALAKNGPAAPANKAPRNEQQQKILDTVIAAAMEDGEAHRRLEEIASSHRYGWFAPGWEVDNVEWSNAFGADDPCLVVSDFIRGLFNGPSRYSEAKRKVHVLDGTDRKILDIILSGLRRSWQAGITSMDTIASPFVAC